MHSVTTSLSFNPQLKGRARSARMLKILAKARIFTIEKTGRKFKLTEACDNVFSASLTAAQLRALGEELIELATLETPGPPGVPPASAFDAPRGGPSGTPR